MAIPPTTRTRPTRVFHRRRTLHAAALCALALISLAVSHDIDRVTVAAQRAFGESLTEVSLYKHVGESVSVLEVSLHVETSTVDAGQLNDVLDAAIGAAGADEEVWLTCTTESEDGDVTRVGYSYSPDDGSVSVRTDPSAGDSASPPTPGPGPGTPTDPDTAQSTSPGVGDGDANGPANGR